MAPRNASRFGACGSRSPRPRDSFGQSGGAGSRRPHDSEGYHWSVTTSQTDLDLVRNCYGVLDLVALNLPETSSRVVGSEGFTARVVLYMSMFFMGLCLPFCCPIRDVLDFLGLAPS